MCKADTYTQLLKAEATTLDASARDRIEALSHIYVAGRTASRTVGCRSKDRVIEDQFKAAALFANYVPDAEPLRNAWHSTACWSSAAPPALSIIAG